MSVQKHQFSQLEEELIELWAKEQTFEQSVEQREGKERFSFYEGPPYANGTPHHGHLVPMSVKDSVTRYKTMRGYFVPRRAGWDTHGLPVEYLIEKELGFNSKQDIVAYGIDKFNEACRQSVFRYKKEWESFYRRIGRWIDTENAYATLDDSFIESIWWVFATIYEKGLIHKGFRSMPYCPRCATPLSNFELNQGYKDGVKDPSLFVKFKLKGEETYLLAWTTTPWTLPGNAALGVDPKADYVKVSYKDDSGKTEKLILAKARLEVLDGAYEVESKLKGAQLVGQTYEPLFDLDLDAFSESDNLYKVWPASFVSLDDGTGIVHIAPAFGEDDLKLGKENGVAVLQTVDEQGKIRKGVGLGELEGVWFKKADELIIERLTQEGRVFAAETFEHTYPFCWRCDTPLMYYAVETWFLDVPKIKQQLLKNNQAINWVPKHIRDGRFGNWLEDAREWGISRNRFWGAPLPVWECEDDHATVVGSIEQLKQKATESIGKIDMHRPGIDSITLKCATCEKPAQRVEEVFDVWFESGSMPYSQDHYPFENKQLFEENFPADFIAESIDQTRGWFYTLHVLSSALFDKPASKNIVVSGWVVAADGQKLSKRLKNYAPLDEVFDLYGADTLRFFMLTSPVVASEDVRFSSDALKEIQRNVFMTLWNVFHFFKTYTSTDQWQPPADLKEPEASNVLDSWILSRLNELITEVTKQADSYQIAKTTRPIPEFIDDLSNWYVRRSRRRFWKSENDQDKEQAYQTLHYVMVRLCQLLAPWAPFMSDRIYRELRSEKMPGSVHLSDWPETSEIDHGLLREMEWVREVINEGLAQRAAAGVKVRQPLSKVVFGEGIDRIGFFESIIAEELNVKEVVVDNKVKERVALVTEVSPELKREGLMRDVVRQVQQLRKESGLEVSDRIELSLATEDLELQKAIEEHEQTIMAETLATSIGSSTEAGKTVTIEGSELTLSLRKVSS